MTDPATAQNARSLTVVRVALHRAADLLEHVDDPPLEVGEALELVSLALEELPPADA